MDAFPVEPTSGREVRLGLSPTISTSHVPGFMFAHRKNQPHTRVIVCMAGRAQLFAGLESNEIDVAVMTLQEKPPPGVRVVHAFDDRFHLIVPAAEGCLFPPETGGWRDWAEKTPWILPPPDTETGRWVHRWFQRRRCKLCPVMEIAAFDLTIQLVGQGLGVALTPIRAMAGHPARHRIKRIPLRPRLSRTIVTAVRGARKIPPHVDAFIESIMF